MTKRRLIFTMFVLIAMCVGLLGCDGATSSAAGAEDAVVLDEGGDAFTDGGSIGDVDPPTGPREGEFVALTYNVHGLPPPITMDDTPGRMVQIAPLLNGFDLIGLQENFDDQNHETLANASEHPHQLRFGEPLEDRFYGSGLAVFSEFEITDNLHHYYSTCHGRFDSASDCLASKGFQVARIRLGPGAEVDVYNSHLEAGGSAEDDLARTVHVDELLEAMTSYSAGRALIFLADTNLHESDPEDAPDLSMLISEAQLSDACDVVMCPEPGRIDRIMYRSSVDVELSAMSWRVEPRFVDGEGDSLSDHDAISARIQWRRVPE